MEHPEILLADLLETDAWIRALARRLVSNADDAEDVAQEAWVRLLSHAPHDRGRVRRWLTTVLRNLVKSRHRADSHRAEREEAAAKAEGVPSVTDLWGEEQLRRRIAGAVFGIEEPYRTAVLLRYYRGYPPREIADRLGVSVAAVEGRLRRGLQKLRARLDRDFGDRKTWCTALLPLTGLTAGEATAVTAATAGALIVGTKLKIAIGAVTLLGLATMGWQLLSGERPPEAKQPEVHAAAEPSPEPAAPTSTEPGPPKVAELQLVAHGAAESESTPPPREESITGKVSNLAGRPIPGATVALTRFTRQVDGSFDTGTIASVKTNAKGSYTIRVTASIRRGIMLEASAKGYYRDRRPAPIGTTQDFRLGHGGSLRGRIRLTSGAPCPDATVVLSRRTVEWRGERSIRWMTCRSNMQGGYTLDALRPGRYSIRVYPATSPSPPTEQLVLDVCAGETLTRDFAVGEGVSLEGRVCDESTNKGLEDVHVRLHRNPYQVAITNREGRFRIPGASPSRYGEFDLDVYKDGYSYSKRNVHRPFDAPEQSGRVRRCRDIYMARHGTVQGRVMAPGGSPIGGATVRFRGIHKTTTTVTDSQGEFTLAGLDPRYAGCQSLYVEADGYPSQSEQIPVGKPGERRTGVVIRLKPGGEIKGRVLDDEGRPVPEAKVVASSYGNAWSTRTAPDGTYSLRAAAGRRSVSVKTKEACEEASSPFSRAQREVVVEEGGCTKADFLLKRGTHVSGRVVDEKGTPVADAVVELQPEFRFVLKPGTRYNGGDTRRSTTDQNGAFRVSGLFSEKGIYLAIAWKDGYDSAWHRNLTAGGPDIELEMSRQAVLRGRVVSAETGKPAPEFWLTAARTERYRHRPGQSLLPSKRLFVDPGGSFQMPLREGTYEISAFGSGDGRSDTRRLDVVRGTAPLPIELRLQRGATLVATVATPEGDPARGAKVQISMVGRSSAVGRRIAPVDDKGKLRASGLAPGVYLLRVFAPTHPDWGAAARVPIDRGSPSVIHLAMARCTKVEFLVKTKAGLACANAWVHLSQADDTPFHPIPRRFEGEIRSLGNGARNFTRTDGTGGVRHRFLPPGEYRVKVTKEGFRERRQSVHVGRQPKQTVEIVLEEK